MRYAPLHPDGAPVQVVGGGGLAAHPDPGFRHGVGLRRMRCTDPAEQRGASQGVHRAVDAGVARYMLAATQAPTYSMHARPMPRNGTLNQHLLARNVMAAR